MCRSALRSNQHSRGPSLVLKRLGHKFDHSPPSSAAIKNQHSYISTPPYGFIACTEVTAPLPLQI